MTDSLTAGYKGSENQDGSEIPDPDKVSWRFERMTDHAQHPDIIYVRIEIDDVPCGFLRLPNQEYLKWIRSRLQK